MRNNFRKAFAILFLATVFIIIGVFLGTQTTTAFAPSFTSCKDYYDIKAYAQCEVEKHWPEQWESFSWIVKHESGWAHTVENKTSGAYGLMQALPRSKMATHGDIHDPQVQIRWGIDYIKERYKSPARAKAFHIEQKRKCIEKGEVAPEKCEGWY